MIKHRLPGMPKRIAMLHLILLLSRLYSTVLSRLPNLELVYNIITYQASACASLLTTACGGIVVHNVIVNHVGSNITAKCV